MLCGLFAGVGYAVGWFLIGSLLLFLSHVLDCTDGNLARAQGKSSSYGKWLDLVGDRVTEVSVFFGAGINLYRNEMSYEWVLLTLLALLFIILYYYVVDIGLAIGFSERQQRVTAFKLKSVHIKWGLLEPVLYGFIVLAPLGLVKVQIVMISILSVLGLVYQVYRNYSYIESMPKGHKEIDLSNK